MRNIKFKLYIYENLEDLGLLSYKESLRYEKLKKSLCKDFACKSLKIMVDNTRV